MDISAVQADLSSLPWTKTLDVSTDTLPPIGSIHALVIRAEGLPPMTYGDDVIRSVVAQVEFLLSSRPGQATDFSCYVVQCVKGHTSSASHGTACAHAKLMCGKAQTAVDQATNVCSQAHAPGAACPNMLFNYAVPFHGEHPTSPFGRAQACQL